MQPKERCNVNRKIRLFLLLAVFGVLSVATTPAQDEPAGPPQQGQGRGQGYGGQRPTAFGKITAVHDGSLEIAGPDGNAVTVKITPQTEFRKDREPAKVSDFKVGDMIMVRGTQNSDGSVTANMIGGRTGGGMMGGGPGGRQGGGMMMNPGTLGKDYVAGEIKAIDPPKMTVLRTDGVTQTLELTEETSLHRGRDSITMADVKVGDHVMAHGAAQGDNFVPKNVMVMNAEQWQRMQERMSQGQGNGNAAGSGASQTPTPAPKPQE
jgi:Cu/Ag efflux protein CusF